MRRIQNILDHPDFINYLSLIEKAEVNRKFCKHHWQHALDVARIAYILYLENQDSYPELKEMEQVVGKELIYAMALLHDVGRFRQYLDPMLDHAREGASLAKPILEASGFKLEEVAIAIQAIADHRNPNIQGTSGLLYQADKLSRHCLQCIARSDCHKLGEMSQYQDVFY